MHPSTRNILCSPFPFLARDLFSRSTLPDSQSEICERAPHSPELALVYRCRHACLHLGHC